MQVAVSLYQMTEYSQFKNLDLLIHHDHLSECLSQCTAETVQTIVTFRFALAHATLVVQSYNHTCIHVNTFCTNSLITSGRLSSIGSQQKFRKLFGEWLHNYLEQYPKAAPCLSRLVLLYTIGSFHACLVRLSCLSAGLRQTYHAVCATWLDHMTYRMHAAVRCPPINCCTPQTCSAVTKRLHLKQLLAMSKTSVCRLLGYKKQRDACASRCTSHCPDL